MAHEMIRLCILIRQLNLGGAQRQLVDLIRALDKERFEVTVMTFYDGGHFCDEIRQIPNVDYVCLNKSGRWDIFPFFARLVRQVKKRRPCILFSFLGLSNILSALLKLPFPRLQIVWTVLSSHRNLSRYGRLARFCYRLEFRLARFADLIIANSHAGREYAIANGFPEKRIRVIPNGIDASLFRPSPDSGQEVRKGWRVGDDEKLVGIVARFDPVKDHPSFIKAAELLTGSRQDLRFVCVGGGDSGYLDELKMLVKSLGLEDRFIWAGARQDMTSVYSALDVLVSSSSVEGLSNVIGEAMACQVPCVVTDVGDSARIVGETGMIVPPKDPEALAGGIEQLLLKISQDAELGTMGRQIILADFALPRMVKATEDELWKLC